MPMLLIRVLDEHRKRQTGERRCSIKDIACRLNGIKQVRCMISGFPSPAPRKP